MSDEDLKAIQYCDHLNKKEDENPTSSESHMGLEVQFVLKPENGRLVIYKVEEWEREGSIWSVVNIPQ